MKATAMTYQLHDPTYSGTTDERSDAQLSQNDFDTDDLSETSGHYLLSESGFPAENFIDLALSVVDPDGHLNRTRPSSAKAGVEQLDDITDEIAENAVGKIDQLAEDEFGDTDFE
jgi:hypothetical protein